MGLFQGVAGAGPPAALSDEERAERIAAILDRARLRRAMAQGQGSDPLVVPVPQEQH